jgi:hypothetical protein
MCRLSRVTDSQLLAYKQNNNNNNAQTYWVFGLFPSSGILETRKHDVSNQIQFPKRRVF